MIIVGFNDSCWVLRGLLDFTGFVVNFCGFGGVGEESNKKKTGKSTPQTEYGTPLTDLI